MGRSGIAARMITEMLSKLKQVLYGPNKFDKTRVGPRLLKNYWCFQRGVHVVHGMHAQSRFACSLHSSRLDSLHLPVLSWLHFKLLA